MLLSFLLLFCYKTKINSPLMQGKKLYFKAKYIVNFSNKTVGFISKVILCSFEVNLRVGSS